MPETILSNITSESEYQGGLTAACGPCAAAVAARWADQSLTFPRTYDVYQKMRSLNLGSANGASTSGDLQTTLTRMGYSVVLPGASEGLLAFSARLAGTCAVVLEVSNGQVLKDVLTGQGEDAQNLQNHYITPVGRNSGVLSQRVARVLPSGAWAADGDNWTQNLVNGVRVHRGLNSDLVYYADTVLAAARPISAFAVLARKKGPMVPAGWHDDATTGTLTAPNGLVVLRGFRDYVLSHNWDADNWPEANEQQGVAEVELFNTTHGSGSIQYFRRSQLSWTAKEGIFLTYVGAEAKYLRWLSEQQAAQIAALQTQINPDASAAIAAFKKALGL